MDGLLICGQTFRSVGPLAKWPGESPDLPWHYDLSGYRGRLPPAQVLAAFELAWKYWSDALDIRPRRVETRREAKVWGTFAGIDGDSGVLAWSMLANGTDAPKEQRYDSGERWSVENPGRPAAGIDLVRVACHEIGHVLGLDHDSAWADALLRPSYSVNIPAPTARDVQRMVGLGYRRRAAPPPPRFPDPPPVGPPAPPPAPAPGAVVVNPETRTVSVGAGWSVVRT